MKHNLEYQKILQLLEEMMHSKSPPYIPKIHTSPVGNEDIPTQVNSVSNQGAFYSRGYYKDNSHKQSDKSEYSPTGLGDLGMRTIFNPAPVGKSPVISKGMPVGFPKCI